MIKSQETIGKLKIFEIAFRIMKTHEKRLKILENCIVYDKCIQLKIIEMLKIL